MLEIATDTRGTQKDHGLRCTRQREDYFSLFFIIGYLSHPLDRVSIEKEGILAEVDLICGLNIEGKKRKRKERKRERFCSSVVLIEYLRIKRFEDCPVASFSRALRDDFYVTCFRGILAENFLLKKRIFSICFYYEIVFVIL